MIHHALERPNTNNYFQFYGLDEVFDIDQAVLKNHYLEKSKQYHPDFFGEDLQAQNIAISTSSYNNIAYKTLSNDLKRAQYLVELKLHEEAAENKTLPQAFLMEMMDLNEAVDEVNESNKATLRDEIAQLKSVSKNYIVEHARSSDWHETQIGILKWKYLERLENRIENLV